MLRTDDVRAATVATRTEPAADRRRRHRIAVGAISTAAAALYAACGFDQYHTFRAGTYDLVIFDQAVRSYSQFRLPVAVAKGVHNGFGTDFSLLGDHFSPILALLAPLYWVYDDPRTLLVAQAVLIASAIVPLWVFTRRELGSGTAYGVAVAYALSWPVAQAVAFDFHEVAFAPVITAIAVERLSAYWRGCGPWWQVGLAAVVLLAVKEDMGLLVAGLGLAIVVRSIGSSPRRRASLILGLGFVVGGAVAALVTTQVLLPAAGGRVDYYWHYGHFGTSVSGSVWHVIAHPVDTARVFVQPHVKENTMLRLIGMAALTPLVSPYLLVAIPPLAERMLSDAPNWWGLDFHYNAFIVVPLFCAGVDGAARIRRRWVAHARPGRLAYRVASRFGPIWACVVLALAVATLPSFAFGDLLRVSAWQRDADMRAATDAVDQVPNGVTVEVANNLGPQLSGRTTVLLWDRLPRWAPWVVADSQRPEFPFCGLAEQRQRITYLEANGYQVVYQGDGYLVLHHLDPLPGLITAPSPGCG